MNKQTENKVGTAETSSTWSVCNHLHGWFQPLKYYFLKWEVFACTDCESLIEANVARKVRALQKGSSVPTNHS